MGRAGFRLLIPPKIYLIMRKVIFLAAVLFSAIVSQGQGKSNTGSGYRTALGLKFWPGGITIKHFTGNNRALEGIGSLWTHGFRFTGLYEIHGDINGAPGLKWYVGPGAHIGAYNEIWYRGGHYYNSGDVSLGIDGVLGLDYKISGAPINLSLDFQPSLELLSHPYFSGWGGLAIRYTF
jgi:hypothetical protein